MNDAGAVRADLDRRLAVALAGTFRLDRVDRSVTGDVAGEVEHQAVALARRQTTAATDDLHVQPRRLGRSQHRDQIDRRGIETGGEHVGVGQAADLAALEGLDQRIALGAGVSPTMVSQEMPCARIASRTWSACSTPEQNTSHERRS
jgi:hypothetical protein